MQQIVAKLGQFFCRLRFRLVSVARRSETPVPIGCAWGEVLVDGLDAIQESLRF